MKLLSRILGISTFLTGVVFFIWSGYYEVMRKQINPAVIATTLLMSTCFIYVGIMSLREKRMTAVNRTGPLS